MSKVDVQLADVSISPVQYQAQLLAALQMRDLDKFTQLLDHCRVDAFSSVLESACREADCAQFVQQLLQHGADPNILNPVLLQTPLHITAELGCYETLQVLLCDDKINVDALDWLGNTALHYAAQNKDQDTVLALLEHGSYIGSRNHAGDMPVSDIEPETLEKFLNTRLKMPNDESLLFKYDFLVPPVALDSALLKNKLSDEKDNVIKKLSSPSPEMDPIVQISLSSKQQHLLLHPIISSFVHLKWQHVQKFYYYNLAFYVFFVLLVTFIILHHHITAIDEHRKSCWLNLSAVCFFKIIMITLLAICCFCLIFKLLFQVCISPVQYLHKWSTYPQLVLTLLTIDVLFIDSGTGESAVTVITLFLAWTRLLLLTGEHPAISICFHMFQKISCTFLKHLAWYSLLIIAFSLSFYALFHDSKAYIAEKNVSSKLFHNPLISFFTTVSMFVGVFETKFLPFETASGTSHIIFILFMFFLILVLLNMFTGLAVSHVQNVQSKSELVRLTAEVNAVFDIEKLVLGNPVCIHMWMRRLNLSHNAVIVGIFKSFVYMWLSFSWLQCFRNIHHSVLLFPDSSFDYVNIVYPFGNSVNVTWNYRLDHKVLLQAANIVKKKNDEARQQLDCWAVFESYEERLNNIEASQLRCEALQQEILQLLRLR